MMQAHNLANKQLHSLEAALERNKKSLKPQNPNSRTPNCRKNQTRTLEKITLRTPSLKLLIASSQSGKQAAALSGGGPGVEHAKDDKLLAK